ncbi:MAG: hypothetical protein ACYDEV_15815 [Acidiferrobacter sp.]
MKRTATPTFVITIPLVVKPGEDRYGVVRRDLERQGTMLAPLDPLRGKPPRSGGGQEHGGEGLHATAPAP